ncbi:MAG: anthranilate phosphoribosyltransferase [Saprospiraceae bacterium]|nr:anthranilate phosphoribosyltransferase [Saprospiraceae bacterium]
MKSILNALYKGETLSHAEAKQILINLTEGLYHENQLAAFLSVFQMRAIQEQELKGFRDALLELCIRIDLSDFDCIDVCGTGGDGKNTLNISTLSAFVVAGAGYQVSKHGNYGVSSVCGSSNVLEYLGYEFTKDENLIKYQLETANISFLHAPLFHPAMKKVAPVRKSLGTKTFFNMLGPMTNPAQPKRQVVGVYSLALARLYNYLYQKTDKTFTILHNLDGYDEISLTSICKVINNKGEFLLKPIDFGSNQPHAQQLYGGETVAQAAHIFTEVLGGQGSSAQEAVVVANAAMAIQCFDLNKPLEHCLAEAKLSLESGAAEEAFKLLLSSQKMKASIIV